MQTTEFYKSYGAQTREDKCVKISSKKYLIVYGFYADPENSDQHYTMHGYYDHQPTKEELKADIEAMINARCSDQILTGFTWSDKPVYLSLENQMNFKTAYDLAVQTDGSNLPIKLKLGEDENGTPVYHTFKALTSFADFFQQSAKHTQDTLTSAWDEKDSVDYSAFDDPQEY